jgi:hypothetical protein
MKKEFTLDFEKFLCAMEPELANGLNESINMDFEDNFEGFGDLKWKSWLGEMDYETKLTITFKNK